MSPRGRFDLSYFLFGIFATLLGAAMLGSLVLFFAFLCVGPCHPPPGGVERADIILVVGGISIVAFLIFSIRWFWRGSTR
jgi:hypothetical protein